MLDQLMRFQEGIQDGIERFINNFSPENLDPADQLAHEVITDRKTNLTEAGELVIREAEAIIDAELGRITDGNTGVDTLLNSVVGRPEPIPTIMNDPREDGKPVTRSDAIAEARAKLAVHNDRVTQPYEYAHGSHIDDLTLAS